MITKVATLDINRKVVYHPEEGEAKQGTVVSYDANAIYVDFGEGAKPIKPDFLKWAGPRYPVPHFDLKSSFEDGDEMRYHHEEEWVPAILLGRRASTVGGETSFEVSVPDVSPEPLVVKAKDLRKVKTERGFTAYTTVKKNKFKNEFIAEVMGYDPLKDQKHEPKKDYYKIPNKI